MSRRVVITGLGVVAPNGVGVPDFWPRSVRGVRNKISASYKDLHFNSQVSGIPQFNWICEELRFEITFTGCRVMRWAMGSWLLSMRGGMPAIL